MTESWQKVWNEAKKRITFASSKPDYAAKYMDENDIIHPAMIYMTDEYGYDKDYYTDEDQPKAGTRSNGEYQFITGEELAQGSRFSVNRNILSFHKEIKSDIKVPCGKSGGDNAKLSVKAPVDFELNYFLTLNGGLKWPFKVYVKEFSTGLEGKFAISPEIQFELHKQWELPADKFKYNVANFHGYTFTFMVGFIPVVVKCNPNMYARINGKVTADMKARLYDISKEQARVQVIRSGFRFIIDPVKDIIPGSKNYEKSIVSFMARIWANYSTTKDEFPAKIAMKELKKMMLDLDEVKQVEAAHKDKFDLIFESAVKDFRYNTCFARYPEVNEKDIQEMIRLIKENAKNY